MNQQSNTVWDPFHDTLPVQRDTAERPTARVKVPAKLKSLAIVGAIAAMGGLIYGYATDREAVLLGSCLAFAGLIGLVFLFEWLSKTAAYHRWLFATIAERNDWSFKLLRKPVERQIDDHDTDRGSGINVTLQRKSVERDQLVAPAYARIAPLLAPSLAQPIPFEIAALYWGSTQKGFPFWMGTAIGHTDMTLAAKELKTDARGNTNSQGHMFQIVAAYRLDRNTDLHAALLAEKFSRDSRKDLKTESSEFNDLFNISIRETSTRQDSDGELELLRVLTPATQATLIDLRKRYKAQIIVENDTIFISGYDLINVEDVEEVAAIAAQAAEEFAEAAVSFKHYAE